MKALIPLGNGITAQVEGGDTQEMFKELARISATFEDSACAKCGNKDLKYVVREVGGNSFYEMRCSDHKCKAKLTFGTPQTGVKDLYPKRYHVHTDGKEKGSVIRDDDGKAKVRGRWGWTIYNHETGEEE